MWVVKIGGSLNTHPRLPQWLDLLAQLGGGRVTVVCGGGVFAEEVRLAQAHWQFDDLAAHNMAVLAMAQTAYMLNGLNPALQLTTTRADIRRVLHKGQVALWLPLELLRNGPNPRTNWDCTSDSIALELAQRMNVERLVLVKSCDVDASLSLAQLGDAGIVDRDFATRAAGAAFPINFLQRDDLDRMRVLLFGPTLPAG